MDLCSFVKGKVKAVDDDDARAQFSQQLEVCKTTSIICVLLAGLTFPAILVTHDDGTKFSAVEQALHIVSVVTSFLLVLSTVGFALQALLFSDILGLMNDPIDGGGEASVPGHCVSGSALENCQRRHICGLHDKSSGTITCVRDVWCCIPRPWCHGDCHRHHQRHLVWGGGGGHSQLQPRSACIGAGQVSTHSPQPIKTLHCLQPTREVGAQPQLLCCGRRPCSITSALPPGVTPIMLSTRTLHTGTA